MYHLSSGILGGIVAVFAMSPLIPDIGGPPGHLAPPANVGVQSDANRTQNSVNRALKGDRLPSRAQSREPDQSIASVEVIGLDNVAVVYRDRLGQILFHTDPLANVTVVGRGIALPEVTIRDSNRAPARPLSLERKREPAPSSTMPIGCESAFSAITEHALARIPARCVSSVQDGQKFAALVQ